jgi:hypothetical protein
MFRPRVRNQRKTHHEPPAIRDDTELVKSRGYTRIDRYRSKEVRR